MGLFGRAARQIVRCTLATLAMAFCIFSASADGRVILYVDDDAPGSGDGLSWMTALSDLQLALEIAAAPGSGIAEIRVAQGVYQPEALTDKADPRSATFKIINGVVIAGGYAGVGSKRPDIRDVMRYETTLTGDLAGDDGARGTFINYAENAYHVVTASGTNSSAVLDGFTITSGSGCCNMNQNDPKGWGGGLHGIDASSTLVHCAFNWNQSNRGGGAYLQGGTPVFIGCTFESNATVGVNQEGGALNCVSGNVELNNCVFQNNTAYRGGALHLSFGDIVVVDCQFMGNQAIDTWGGAVYFGLTTAQIESSSFTDNSASLAGGAVFSNISDLLVTNCDFILNSIDEFGNGGAVAIDGAPATIEKCTFTANGGLGASGGAVWSDDPTTINSCSFISNSVPRGVGGAIVIGANFCTKESSISSCQFIDNSAERGGAIEISTSCTISDCTFEANRAIGIGIPEGGAIYSSYGKTAPCVPTVIRCSFKDNKATWHGGAVVNDGGLDLTEFHPVYQDCEFIGNEAASLGGAVYNSASSPILINCTFATNGSGNRGGAIFNDPFCVCDVINCTFYANFALTTGGAIEGGDMFGLTKVVNSIFRANTPDQIHELGKYPVNVSYSNVQGGWPGLGSHNIDAVPLFVDPANGDFSIAQGSPCIDRADGTSFPLGIATDFAGNPRFVDDVASLNIGNGPLPLATLDMGAFEFQLPLGSCPPDCAAPFDKIVNASDLMAVIDAWSATSGTADINSNGKVDVDDLLLVIENWGPCP